MSVNPYDRRVLTRVVQDPSLKTDPRWFIDRFFKSAHTSAADHFDYEMITGHRRLASFRRVGQGPHRTAGKRTANLLSVKFPLIDEEDVITATDLQKVNSAGNIYLDGAEGINAATNRMIADRMQLLKNTVLRTEEWMAIQMMLSGKIVYEGPENAFTIDLGWDAAFKPSHAGSDLWSGGTAPIRDQVREYSRQLQAACGSPLGEIHMGTKAASDFLADPNVQKDLDRLNFRVGQVELDVASNYLGKYQNVPVYEVTETYENEEGNMVEMFPAHKTLFVASNLQSERVYGGIQTLDGVYVGNLLATSTEDKDAESRKMRLRSRPIPVIYQNGSIVSADVTTPQ